MLNLARLAAISAGVQILRHYDDYEISYKSDNSPVTSADLSANEAILSTLSQSKIPICSEESLLSLDELVNLERFWLVDPLDGTKDFICKTGEFCVCIALIEHGRPILAVIYAPKFDEMYYSDGHGLYGGSAKNPTQILSCKAQNILMHGSHSGISPFKKTLISRFNLRAQKLGSALKYCKIALGEASLSVGSAKMSLWDAAAGDFLLCQSGGKVIDLLTKKAPLYNGKDGFKMHPTLAVNQDSISKIDEICEIYSKFRA